MLTHEIRTNLHIHTNYSDGNLPHKDVAAAACQAGLDALIITDHNVLVKGVEGYYEKSNRRTLLLVGEEIHDQARDPQKNHLLALGVTQDFAPLAADPQTLISAIQSGQGLSFIAHPIDPALPMFNETDISWIDWSVTGFTGLELWNGFSELKTVIKSRAGAILYAFFPELIAHAPLPGTLQIWDDLLAKGSKIVAIGGSDAHATRMRMGPLSKIIFPYQFHFSAINTHLLLPDSLNGNVEHDKALILNAYAHGNAFIGYDLPAPTDGFRFFAHNATTECSMGDSLPLEGSVTIQIHTPHKAETRLIHNGICILTSRNQNIIFTATQPGYYRVESYRKYLGRTRGWIFSNPIYLHPAKNLDFFESE